MRATAQRMRDNARRALERHVRLWSVVQECITPLPGFMQTAFHTALDPYDHHVRLSIQTQLDFADSLQRAADSMGMIDDELAGSMR